MTLLLIVILATSVESKSKTECSHVKIEDKIYEREVLWKNIGRPHNLNVYKPTNTLFFAYSVLETYSDFDFQIGYYNIDTKEYQMVAGVKGGCTIAIDHSNDEVYMGGSDGIYKFNTLTKIADYYGEKGKNIWSLFHKNKLFYINYPDQKLHLEVNGTFAVVREFEDFEVEHFFISSTSQIYFSNESGLFTFDIGSMSSMMVYELITVRQIVEDNDGNLYVCTNFGILLALKPDVFQQIVDFKDLFGLAFDRDNNFIISVDNSIVRLKRNMRGCDNGGI